MNQQDKALMKLFAALIGVLVVVAIAAYVISATISDIAGPDHDRTEQIQANIERRLQPVGRVVVAGSPEAEEAVVEVAEVDEDAAPGEQVYNTACFACHGGAVPGAPVKGDRDAWSALYQDKGLDMLIQNAISGINAMPPRGGRPDLSDEAIHDAVVYILRQSEVLPDAADEEPVAEAEEATIEELTEPMEEEITIDEEAAEAVEETAESEVVEEATETVDVVPAEEPAAVAAGDFQIPDGIDPAAGQSTYSAACTACHGQGIAGAPRTGDVDAWAERIAQGWDMLAEHTLNGIGTMPPKGGFMHLSDEEVLSAMAYMVEESR